MANFSSLMGYQYHQKRCGKQLAEADKPVFSCPHCGKKYKSKAGHDYHVRSEHSASVSPPDASAARGAGPSPPGGDGRAAEPVGRTGPGKAGADVGPMLFSPSHHRARVLYQAVSGGTGCSPLQKTRVLLLREWSSRQRSPSLVPSGLCSSPPCIHALQGKKTRAPAAPSAASKHQLRASAGVAGSVPGEHPFLCC